MSLFVLFVSGVALGQAFRFFPFLSLFLLAAVAVLGLLSRPARGPLIRKAMRWSILLLCAFAGFVLSRQAPPHASPSELSGTTLEIEGIASSGPVPAGRDERLFSQSASVKRAGNSGGRELQIREVRLLTEVPLSEGRAYRITARTPRDSHFLNPGSLSRMPSFYVLDATELGVAAAGPLGRLQSVFSGTRGDLNRELRARFSDRTAPFLMSQITGDRRFISKELKDSFNVTGLAHLLSISGTHFGLLFLVLFRLSKFLLKRLPHRTLLRMTLHVTPSQLGALLCLPFMVWYLGISDASIPAVRSFIMINFFLMGLVLQRRGLWLNTVLIAAVIILAPDPSAVLDLSFQLSFAAVLCIGVALEQLRGTKTRDDGPGAGPEMEFTHGAADRGLPEKGGAFAQILRAARQGLTYSLVTSLAATIGTAPLVAYHFHYFSVISPLTNLVITPFIGFLLLPVSLLSSFVFLLSGHFPLTALIEGLADLAVTSVLFLGRVSFADVKVPGFPPLLLLTFYAGLLGYMAVTMMGSLRNNLTVPRGLRHVAAAVAIIPFVVYGAVASVSSQELTVTYLDVGQGDAAVVELPDGRTLVIDTGKQGVQVGEYLRYRGKRGIDALVLSHGQSDHVGGVRYLAGNFRIAEVWHNGNLTFDETLAGLPEHRPLTRGDVVDAAGCRVMVLHPHKGFYTTQRRGGELNNDSLVVKVSGREKSFLFTGDIENEAQDDLLHLGTALRSTVLKLPHHGSRSALHKGFLKAVSPEAAVVSAGRSNIYGFPHPEVLGVLATARVYRTDVDGAVVMRESSDGSLTVRTWREFQLVEAGTLSQEVRNLGRLFLAWR